MALWGNKDKKTPATGSISIATDGTVTGTGTAFLTELKIGNTIRNVTASAATEGWDFQVVSITSDTVCKVISGKNTGNGLVAGATVTCTATNWTISEKPAFVAHESASSGTTGLAGLTVNGGDSGDSTKVFGADVNEVNATSTGHRGFHAGWVRRTVGTGGRAGRVFYETLVASGSVSTAGANDQADDTQFPDA